MKINKGRVLWILILFFLISFSSTATFWAQENGKVKVEEQLILINNSDGQFEIKELYQFTNKGEESLQEDLIINLPEGAANIYISKKEFGDKEKTLELDSKKYTIKDNQITITEKISGGQSTSLLVFYTIENLQTLRTLNYPTDQIYVLVPLGLNLESDLLHSSGIKVLDEVHFQVFGNHDLKKGEEFLLRIISSASEGEKVTKEYMNTTGFHGVAHLNRWTNSPLANTNPHLWLAFLFLLGLGLLFFTLFLLRSKGDKKTQDIVYLIAKQQRLLGKIRDLDLKRKNEEIDQETHEELRKQYKQLLIKVKLRIKSLGED